MHIANNVLKIHFVIGGLVQPHGYLSSKTKAQNEVREEYAYIGILNQLGHKEDPWTWNKFVSKNIICILQALLYGY